MTNNRIAENTVENCAVNCIALIASSGVRLTNTQVSSNSLSDSTVGNGIVLQVDGGAVSSNLILDIIFFDNFLNGIFLWPGANDNRVFNNEFRTNNLAALAGAAAGRCRPLQRPGAVPVGPLGTGRGDNGPGGGHLSGDREQ
jgi:parallel beta-helix repeat protein